MSNFRSYDEYCRRLGWNNVWFISDIFFLIMGLASNSALLLLFLKERKSISASMILGWNLVAMNLIFICTVPVRLILAPTDGLHINDTVTISHDAGQLERVTDICSMFNMIGCPLLLTCMCVERYLAVVKPVLYMRAGKWEYRMAVSLMVWGVTLLFILGIVVVRDIGIILTAVPVIITCLFITMLACLGRIIWSLMQKSPAHTTHANRGPDSALKRRAVYNVLVVVVPAVISYLPIMAIVPFELGFYDQYFDGQLNICNIFELSNLFPRFGVFIGPMFYFSKARKLRCISRMGEKLDRVIHSPAT